MLTGEVLRQTANRLPDKTALICGDASINFQSLNRAADRFANALLAEGYKRGDRMAIMSPNLIEYVIAHFGAARAGAVIVNLMPAYSEAEMETILAATDARLIVAEVSCLSKVKSIQPRLPALEKIIVIGNGADGDAVSFDAFLDGGEESEPDIRLDPSDPFAMTFTGGTTGTPKGTLVSHQCRFVSTWTTALEHGVTETDIVGQLTPLYHAMGSLVWMPTGIFLGATSVIMTGWDADRFIDATARHGISGVLMVPVQLQQVLSETHFDPEKLRSLKNIACGGAITPAGLVHDVGEKMPWARFTNHYGQSETGPICLFKPYHPRDKADTIGKPAIGTDLRIVDPDGIPVPDGETGEIIVRGPFLMDGYFNNEEETSAYFRNGDGWGWTGDLATRDEDGFISLVGRSKDMIVSGGINIYPREIEIVLESHEAVIDCTVFGVPDEKWGEALIAYVVIADGHSTAADELIGFCTDKLARFKRPREIQLVDAIPKTPSGKVQKPKLRDAWLAQNQPV